MAIWQCQECFTNFKGRPDCPKCHSEKMRVFMEEPEQESSDEFGIALPEASWYGFP